MASGSRIGIINGWVNGWMDGGWITDGEWMDGWKEERKKSGRRWKMDNGWVDR